MGGDTFERAIFGAAPASKSHRGGRRRRVAQRRASDFSRSDTNVVTFDMLQPQPSGRTLAGILLILLLIVLWAGFVASLASFVGRWPVLVQAPFYLFMGIAWIIPLKPLVRWIQSGSFRRPIE